MARSRTHLRAVGVLPAEDRARRFECALSGLGVAIVQVELLLHLPESVKDNADLRECFEDLKSIRDDVKDVLKNPEA